MLVSSVEERCQFGGVKEVNSFSCLGNSWPQVQGGEGVLRCPQIPVSSSEKKREVGG